MMKHNVDTNKAKKQRSEGSSLAIALFLFMVCSLMCAGLLYLANSTSRGVSKSYNYAQNLTFDPPPTPTPTPTPTPPPEPDPAYQTEVDAIDTVYSNLNYSFLNGFLAAEQGISTEYLYEPQNMTYEILSYIHSYYGDNGKVPVTKDAAIGDSISVPFTYVINGTTVKVLVEMTGTNGSQKNNGLRFHTCKMTVSSENPECTYYQVLEYTVNNGKDGKFYFKWSNPGGKKRFTLKNTN